MMKIYEIKVKIFSIVFMSLNQSKINRIHTVYTDYFQKQN